MTNLPSLFLAHGAPDLPLGDHPAKRFLATLPDRLPRPRAILIVSAHWEERQVTVQTTPQPMTIYDFAEWPEELYDIRYPARTDADLVAEVVAILKAAGVDHALDAKRGYDHGAWVPLILSYADASVPVVQVSLVRGKSAQFHFDLGRALAPLRDRGVLIVGSGATVHNLRELAPEGSPTPEWATTFETWIDGGLKGRDLSALLHFPSASLQRAHPTPEHFLPFYFAAGAGWDGGRSTLLHRSFSYGSIGMACYAFGGRELEEISDTHVGLGLLGAERQQKQT